MTKAYSYARFSKKTQAEGDSLRRQLAAAFEYAEKHGLELDTTVQDHGVSSFTGANRLKGALKGFLDRVESGEIERGSYLLLDSMDRLSREDVIQATHQLLGIALAGLVVVTLSDGRKFDRNSSMADVMMAVVEIERSHRESAEKGRKVAKAHAERKRQAREEGRAWHRSGPTWLRSEVTGEGRDRKIKYHQIPEKVAIVQRIFDMFEDGLGSTAIAAQLTADKVETPRAGKSGWHHSAVLETVKNRAVLGEYQPHFAGNEIRGSRRPVDGDPIPGYYGKGIIDPAQFHRVQAIIAKRQPVRGRGANTKDFTNIFIGMGVCSECGGRIGMHTASKHPKWQRSAVLRCYNAARKAPGPARPGMICTNTKRFKYEPFETAVLRHFTDFDVPEERRRQADADLIAKAEAERDDLNRRIENLIDQEEDGDRRAKARRAQREAELKAKEAEITALKASGHQLAARLPFKTRQERLLRLVERMGEVEGAELYRLRAAVSEGLRSIIYVIDFDPNGHIRVIVGGGGKIYRFRDGGWVDVVGLTAAGMADEQLVAGLTGNDPALLKKLAKVIGA